MDLCGHRFLDYVRLWLCYTAKANVSVDYSIYLICTGLSTKTHTSHNRAGQAVTVIISFLCMKNIRKLRRLFY